eukprot:TRINITY_DN957_c0_g1_i6.p1 TRINITY_DN957_c0_g1~~TRINITY_DN957_c0_g1_i6.p1  ORF type:complete len:400 (-),score=86.81 TRINITY_DN957_c0_g1_i6:385-1506(-)
MAPAAGAVYTSPCEKYPRVLEGFLSTSDVDYIKHLFKEVVEKEWEKREDIAKAAGLPKPKRMLEYFTLLRYLQTHEPRDARFEEIIAKIYDKVEKQFGAGFIIANDFWSWRTPTNVAAERVHMDADFWMAEQEDGFNLWILLDHHEMPYTFDIYTKEENLELYKITDLPKQSYWMLPEEKDEQKYKECPGFLFWEPLAWWPVLFEWKSSWTRTLAQLITTVFMKWWMKSQLMALRAKEMFPTWLFRLLMWIFGWTARLYCLPAGLELKTKRFDVQTGDAFVVRQQELHGTDHNPLKAGQYRLAIGFKFMRQAIVKQYSYTSPASKSRRRFPGLRVPLGKPLIDAYRSTGIDMHPFDEGVLGSLANERFTKATQ